MFHKLHVIGVDNNSWGRVLGLGSETVDSAHPDFKTNAYNLLEIFIDCI